MRLDEPSWWYTEKPRFIAWLLLPVGVLYDRFARRRFRRSRPYRSSLPVLCVGNFTAGGSGKTPMAQYIAGRLAVAGYSPYFLTRGYSGKLVGPHFVDPARDCASDVGDETLLLAACGPTVMSRDRIAGAKAIEERAKTETKQVAIIMDDGLQNPSLMKDFSLAMVSAGRGVGNGLPIPSGPLRIDLGFQLGLVDAIVVNDGAAVGSEARPGPTKRLRGLFDGPVFNAEVRPSGETAWMRGASLVAYAGIADPDRFFALVARLGGIILERHAYPDHHAYSEREASELLNRAANLGATLVTTEKDLSRLSRMTGSLASLAAQSRALSIGLALPEAERFDEALLRALNSPR